MKQQKFDIDEKDLKKRVDVVIARELPDLSRSYIKRLAKEDKITFNGKPVNAGYKMRIEGKLVLDYDMTELKAIPEIDLPIIHEDESLVVVNKPSGVITHSRGRYWDEPSVASSIRKRVYKEDASNRAGIIHRLDRGTSGVIICGKTETALKKIQKQFEDRAVWSGSKSRQ